jgi:hypothetical protein
MHSDGKHGLVAECRREAWQLMIRWSVVALVACSAGTSQPSNRLY